MSLHTVLISEYPRAFAFRYWVWSILNIFSFQFFFQNKRQFQFYIIFICLVEIFKWAQRWRNEIVTGRLVNSRSNDEVSDIAINQLILVVYTNGHWRELVRLLKNFVEHFRDCRNPVLIEFCRYGPCPENNHFKTHRQNTTAQCLPELVKQISA